MTKVLPAGEVCFTNEVDQLHRVTQMVRILLPRGRVIQSLFFFLRVEYLLVRINELFVHLYILRHTKPSTDCFTICNESIPERQIEKATLSPGNALWCES